MSEAGAPEPSTEPPVTAAAEVAAQNSRDTGSSEGLRTMTDETTPVMRASEKTSTEEEEEDDDKSSSVLLPQEAAQVEQSKGGDKGKNPESNTTEFDSSGLDNMSPLTLVLVFVCHFFGSSDLDLDRESSSGPEGSGSESSSVSMPSLDLELDDGLSSYLAAAGEDVGASTSSHDVKDAETLQAEGEAPPTFFCWFCVLFSTDLLRSHAVSCRGKHCSSGSSGC